MQNFDPIEIMNHEPPAKPVVTRIPGDMTHKKTLKVTLGGDSWTVVSTSDLPDSWGMCFFEEKMILLNQEVKPKRALNTAVHEAAHAICPWMTEHAVNNMGNEMSALLWKLGYRKVK